MAGLDEGQEVTTEPTPFIFGGRSVFLLNGLVPFDRKYFIGCMKNLRTFIVKKNVPVDAYWYAAYTDTAGWYASNAGNKKAKVLICENWVRNNFPEYTKDTSKYKYKALPPLVELEDHEKFRDQDGNVYEVEVRGVKTKLGIRFKCKDIRDLFEMDWLETHINRMLNSDEYELFYSAKLAGGASLTERGGQPTEMYLTYNGLLKVIFKSNSGIGYKFQDWATDIIYTAQFGNQDQRVDVAANILGVNAQLVKDVLGTCITNMPCVYLFEVGKVSEMAKVYPQIRQLTKNDTRGSIYKYGRTNNLFTRTGKHIETYGSMANTRLKLRFFSPVDVTDCVKAEGMIREQFEPHHIALNVEGHNFVELVVINKNEIGRVKTFYHDLYKRFSSEVNKLLQRVNNAELVNKGLEDQVQILNDQVKYLKEQREQTRLDHERRHQEQQTSHQEELNRLLERLSVSESKHKQCQDVLCTIALLTPQQRDELDRLFGQTKEKLDPFLK
jgi:RecB family exonuclease